MAKKKNFYYVLVLTAEGPTFVTEVSYRTKIAEWKKDQKPLDFSKEAAEDLAFGLTANFWSAYAIHSRFEITEQPYKYDLGHFEWKWNSKKKGGKKNEQ